MPAAGAGFNKTECGIHFDFNGPIAKPDDRQGPDTLSRTAPSSPIRGGPGRRGRSGAGALYACAAAGVSGTPGSVCWQSASAGAAGVAGRPDRGGRGRSWRVSPRSPSPFPAFTDGRGYSTARLLTERYDYQGELRAVGDVLTDQIPFMRRCGFNALVVTHEPTRKALQDGATDCRCRCSCSRCGASRSAGGNTALPAPRGQRDCLGRPVRQPSGHALGDGPATVLIAVSRETKSLTGENKE